MRAKSPVDGALVGTVIICRQGNLLAEYMPVLHTAGGGAWAGPWRLWCRRVRSQAWYCRGWRCWGFGRIRRIGQRSVLNWVSGEEMDTLLGMGFDILDAFEELCGQPERVSFV